jgi:hypothetical protein
VFTWMAKVEEILVKIGRARTTLHKTASV